MSYLPCPEIGGVPDCPYRNKPSGCHESEHHLYWPAANYIGAIAKVFRNLPDNKELVCRRLHDALHANTTPPDVPPTEEMREAIITAEEAGQIVLSAAKKRAVYGQV